MKDLTVKRSRDFLMFSGAVIFHQTHKENPAWQKQLEIPPAIRPSADRQCTHYSIWDLVRIPTRPNGFHPLWKLGSCYLERFLFFFIEGRLGLHFKVFYKFFTNPKRSGIYSWSTFAMCPNSFCFTEHLKTLMFMISWITEMLNFRFEPPEPSALSRVSPGPRLWSDGIEKSKRFCRTKLANAIAKVH